MERNLDIQSSDRMVPHDDHSDSQRYREKFDDHPAPRGARRACDQHDNTLPPNITVDQDNDFMG